jgi:3',5'-cyclic AMP phosphodiesterase CpdA
MPAALILFQTRHPMSAQTIVQLSDTHLSPSRPFFQFNYEIVLEELAAIKPDHIFITGDLALNGPDDIADVAFARQQFDRLPCPWSAIPGNHDVGLVPFAGGLHQAITNERLRRYLDVMESDRFVKDVGQWRFIGINSQLLGSGLDAEEEQFEWLSRELQSLKKLSTLFLHYPVFLDNENDVHESHTVVHPDARKRLLALIDNTPHIRLVASGHLHVDRQWKRNGVSYQWAPSTAFITTDEKLGGVATAGFLVYKFNAESFTVDRVEPRWMINHDVRNWSGSEPHGYYEIVKRPFPKVG